MKFREVALIWLLSRAWHAMFVYLGHLQRPFLEPIEGGFIGVSNWWLNPWTTYDSQHFLQIAASGYTRETTPFFPLYPLLMRPFGPNENALALAGVVISNLAFLGALWGLFHLTTRDYDFKTGRVAVWILAFYPMGAAAMSVYTESLFLLLGIGGFWVFRSTNSKIWSTPLLFAASLVRNTGPIFAVAVGWEWLQKQRERRRAGERIAWTGLLVVLAPALAFVAVQFYFRTLFDEGLATVGAQNLYLRALTVPGLPIVRDAWNVVRGVGFDLTTLLNLASTVIALVLVWRFRREQPRADALLIVGVLLVHLTIARTIPPYTNGSLRYLFGLWPFSQLLALWWVRSPLRESRIALVSVGGMALLGAALMAFLWGVKSFPG